VSLLQEDAMVTSCGHSFSQVSIESYVQQHGKCPVCQKTLQQSELAPNYKLREAIAQYRKYKETEDDTTKGEHLLPKDS